MSGIEEGDFFLPPFLTVLAAKVLGTVFLEGVKAGPALAQPRIEAVMCYPGLGFSYGEDLARGYDPSQCLGT